MKDPVGTVWGRVESCDVFRVRLPVVDLVPLCRRGSFWACVLWLVICPVTRSHQVRAGLGPLPGLPGF